MGTTANRAPLARRRLGRSAVTILVAATAATATTAAAVAARPQGGSHFSGFTAAGAINGFKPPVTFSVSGNGGTLLNFQFGSFGCFGAGGFQPGIDYYTKPENIIKVGTVKVSKSGRFSVAGAVFKRTAFGITTKTTVGVSGSFTSAKAAKGTITFKQQDTGKYTSACGPASLAFTAKKH